MLGEEADDDRVVEDVADHAAATDGDIDDPAQQRLERLWIRVDRFGRFERRLERSKLHVDGGDDDRFLRLELVVDGRLRHADGAGDHLERRAADAVLRRRGPGRQ